MQPPADGGSREQQALSNAAAQRRILPGGCGGACVGREGGGECPIQHRVQLSSTPS